MLGWHLLTGTLPDWVLYFIRKLDNEDGWETSGEVGTGAEADVEGREEGIPFDLYYRCMDLCDRLILEYEVGNGNGIKMK